MYCMDNSFIFCSLIAEIYVLDQKNQIGDIFFVNVFCMHQFVLFLLSFPLVSRHCHCNRFTTKVSRLSDKRPLLLKADTVEFTIVTFN